MNLVHNYPRQMLMPSTTGTDLLADESLAVVSLTKSRCTTFPVSRNTTSSYHPPIIDHPGLCPEFNGLFPRDHPQLIKDNIAEVEEFARDLHSKVLDPLHDLVSLALELPQDFFRNLHKYESKSEDHLRYMKYSKYDEEGQRKILAADGLYSQGHTDLGTLTLLFRQPVAALQIKDHKTGDWKWAKPLNGSLTVNVSGPRPALPSCPSPRLPSSTSTRPFC
jgi:hypothetical protein